MHSVPVPDYSGGLCVNSLESCFSCVSFPCNIFDFQNVTYMCMCFLYFPSLKNDSVEHDKKF